MLCRRCGLDKSPDDFYPKVRKCKECTKAAVRKNRLEKVEYYRDYDRARIDKPDRVAMRKRINKEWSTDPEKRERRNSQSIKNTIKFPQRREARLLLGYALKAGRIASPEQCERCGMSGLKLHAHHEDYDKPLDVVWLCLSCHGQRHREINALKRSTAIDDQTV